MAGDWIKTRTNLSGDPAVKAISRGLKLDTFSVVGRLHEFWSWADQHTDDGELPLTVLDDIDEVAQKRGFAAEMVRVGWLIDNGNDGVCIPKWDRHNGDSAKKRCLTQERMGRLRKRNRDAAQAELLPECDAESVTFSEQKRQQRREEKSISPIVPVNGDVKEADEALLIRAKSLFLATAPRLPLRLDRSQLAAWKKNKGAVEQTTEEEWVLLEEAYAQSEGDAARFRRKDLAQLLNNWCGEITRAADWKKKAGPQWRWQVQAAAKAGGERAAEPKGWRGAVIEIYPDSDCDGLEWTQLSADVRAAVEELLKKKNGGGDE